MYYNKELEEKVIRNERGISQWMINHFFLEIKSKTLIRQLNLILNMDLYILKANRERQMKIHFIESLLLDT